MLELTETQANLLKHGADNAPLLIFVKLPSDNDATSEFNKMTEEVGRIDALVSEGLLKDLSDRFESEINMLKQREGRSYRVVMLTDIATAMFSDHKAVFMIEVNGRKRLCNVRGGEHLPN